MYIFEKKLYCLPEIVGGIVFAIREGRFPRSGKQTQKQITIKQSPQQPYTQNSQQLYTQAAQQQYGAQQQYSSQYQRRYRETTNI